jgi:hypothetical protein
MLISVTTTQRKVEAERSSSYIILIISLSSYILCVENVLGMRMVRSVGLLFFEREEG